MDDADIAQRNSEIHDEAAIRAHLAKRPVSCVSRQPCLTKYVSVCCVDCGTLIPKARLEANPEATRCIRCQTKHERR